MNHGTIYDFEKTIVVKYHSLFRRISHSILCVFNLCWYSRLFA